MDRSDLFWKIGIIAAAVLTTAAYLVVSPPVPTASVAATAGRGAPSEASDLATPSPIEAATAPEAHPLPALAEPAVATVAPVVPPPQAATRDDLEVLVEVLEELTAADGTLPGPIDTLVRTDRDGRLVVAAGTQRRYRPLVEALAGVDPAAVANELGRPDVSTTTADLARDDLEARLHATVDSLLAMELPAVEPTMVVDGPGWGFAEREYAGLPDAERHLLRMGRRQAREVQAKLEEIRRACAWPEPRDGRPALVAAVSAGEPGTAPDGTGGATLAEALPHPAP